jgi:hypothetical protein
VGEDGTTLVHWRDRRCQPGLLEESWDRDNLAFLLQDNVLEPIVIDRLIRVEAASAGPDGQVFLIIQQQDEDNPYDQSVIGLRVDGPESSVFTDDSRFDSSTHFLAMTFDVDGNLYLVFEQGGDGIEDHTWLSMYPTGDRFR